MLTCNWAHGAMIVDHPTSCLLWMVSQNPTCSRKGCWSASPLILVVLLRTSGRGTWIFGHLILIFIHESATAYTPLSINGAPSLPGGPWSHIRHTPFLDTCFLIFLMTLFAVWLASDFVPTLYELKKKRKEKKNCVGSETTPYIH